MGKKTFSSGKLDQVKERTSNMFQQCGGSGTVSPPQYIDQPIFKETELKISTLESTYRTPHFTSAPRHAVSDSNIFMHRDMDWYRESKPIAEYGHPASLEGDRNRFDTITTRVQTPGNVLVRFRTFLGMDGSLVEVVTNNADCVIDSNVRSEENALVKMKNIFSSKGRHDYTVGVVDDARGSNAAKTNKIKGLFKKKNNETQQQQQAIETVVAPGPEERIVRMKTFFTNRSPGNTVVIESKTSSSESKNNLEKIRTLFKTDTASQTDDAPSSAAQQKQSRQNVRGKFKKLLGISENPIEEHEKEEPITNIDERQIFSRQSTLPAQTVEERPPVRIPGWMDNFFKRVRASCSGARVNDIEIPSAVVMDPKDTPVHSKKKKHLGSITGWRWKRPEEVRKQQQSRKSKDACSWMMKCPDISLPKLNLTTSSLAAQVVTASFTQVIALICGILVIILMALGLSSADWLMAAGWRQGLFTHCVEEGAPTPLPFNLVEQPGCYASRDVGYIRAAAALCIVTLCTDVLGTLLTGLGLRATDNRTKYKYYRLAVLAMSLALISILIALVIYPVCFAAELNLGNRTVWEFGWAYGVGWGAAIFLFGAVILLLCDKESEEIYYKERKVERAQPPGGA